MQWQKPCKATRGLASDLDAAAGGLALEHRPSLAPREQTVSTQASKTHQDTLKVVLLVARLQYVRVPFVHVAPSVSLKINTRAFPGFWGAMVHPKKYGNSKLVATQVDCSP